MSFYSATQLQVGKIFTHLVNLQQILYNYIKHKFNILYSNKKDFTQF